jgi:hypothetical protein
MDNITLTFLAHITVAALTMFLVFYSYSKIFSKFIPALDNMIGGFIIFVALNEVIAVPFMLQHLKFSLFLKIFIFVNGMVFVNGIRLIMKSRMPIFNKNIIRSPFFLFSIVLLMTGIVSSQLFAYYSADDSFYVSLVEQNKDSDELYSLSPATGKGAALTLDKDVDPTKQLDSHLFPKAYRFQGWELIESAMSEVFRLSTTELVHGLVPIMIISLIYLLFRNIFSYFLKSDKVYFALSLVFIMYLFGGYSTRSPSFFIMTRPWQGKAILAGLIVPLLSILLFKAYKKGPTFNLISSIMILNIASLSLNPSSVFINLSIIGAIGLVILKKYFSISTAAKLASLALPFIPIIIFTLVAIESRGGSSLRIKSYLEYGELFIGTGWYFLIWVAGVALLYKTKFMIKYRSFMYLFPVVLFLTVLNPYLYETISDNVTSTAYWRLFWLVPLYIYIPLIGVEVSNQLGKYVNHNSRTSLRRTFAPLLIILVFIVSGSFVYSRRPPVLEYNSSINKAPAGVFEVSQFLKGLPHGVILAPQHPSILFHNYSSEHEVLAPRSLDVRVNYRRFTEDYIIRRELIRVMAKKNVLSFDAERFHHESKRFDVNYIVYDVDNSFIHNYVREYSPIELFRNDQYIVVKR